MRQFIWCFVLFLAMGMLLFAAEIEAESGKSISGGASVIMQAGASGGKAVRFTGNGKFRKTAPQTGEPADWQVIFSADKTGMASLSLQVHGPDNGSDSCYWSLNGGPVKPVFGRTHQPGERLSLGNVKLNKGDNVLNLWCRETRFTVDVIRILPPEQRAAKAMRGGYPLDLAKAILNPDRAERTADGVRLKPGVQALPGQPELPGDVEFHLTLPAGRYQLRTAASIPPDLHRELMKKKKEASPRADILVDEQFRPQLCILVAWRDPKNCERVMGKYTFTGKEQKLKFFLPPGVTLKAASLHPYSPPKIPAEVLKYQPKVTPPATRPRLLVTQKTLPQVRRNLTVGENAPVWAAVRKMAAKKLSLNTNVRWLNYNVRFEETIQAKAFVALMDQDRKLARETIELMDAYMQKVDFGNMQDITRAIGRAIRIAALVYDWCYDEMTPAERGRMRKNMFRLADDMECSWPPFKQSIVVGHGCESQMTNDLFSMAAAIYDEDPLPHRILAYRMLEELEPVHALEYKSGRHHQGMSYGMSRFACDMMGAWNTRRTWEYALFGDTVRRIPYYWLYMRLPDGEIMRDGDDWVATQQQGKYWQEQRPFFLCYTYLRDPVLKGEAIRMGDLTKQGILFLLFNDPELKPEFDRSSLPLTYMAKEPYPAMIARTGWDFGPQANDAIAYITGAGLNAGNHQHANSGAFQIYYRGMLAADLGSYVFYWTPYDVQFNKQSVSHSMMLLRDPEDPKDNGGQWFGWKNPKKLSEMEVTRCGRTLGFGFGPDAKLPLYSYLKTDLTAAYPKGRAELHERTFFVLNTGCADAPMTVIVTDRIKADKKYQKIWQINSFTVPKAAGKTFEILSLNGEGKLTLFPVFPEVRAEILSGKASHSVFGKQYSAPREKMPEANGSRLMLTPAASAEKTDFLAVMQITRSGTAAVKPAVTDVPGGKCVSSGNWRVIYGMDGKSLNGAEVSVPAGTDVLISDLKPGIYDISGLGGTRVADNGLLFFRAEKAGKYTVRPTNKIGKPLDVSRALAPKINPHQIHFK